MAMIRVSNAPIELLISRDSNVRVSQLVANVVFNPSVSNVRVSQLVLEVIVYTPPYVPPPITGARVKGPAVQCI